MAKKHHKVRMVPESNPDSKFIMPKNQQKVKKLKKN